MEKLKVGILVFDDVEVLDFCGPFEVFSRTRMEPGLTSRASFESAPFHVFTVTREVVHRDEDDPSDVEPIFATGGLRILPDYSFNSCPAIDVLVVPGGLGTRRLLDEPATLDWIRWASGRAKLTCSICTGSLLLAKSGLLNGRRATTHWGALELLASLGKGITVVANRRFVEDGVVTSAGISAGIDMSLRVVDRICGHKVAKDTARYMDYPFT